MELALEFISNNLGGKITSMSLDDPLIKTAIPFAKEATGAGAPFYLNSKKNRYDGKLIDDITLERAKKMAPSEMVNTYAVLGARNQRSGYDYDTKLMKSYVEGSASDIKALKQIMRKRKPSKSRVIYMYNRSENYITAQVVVPVTKSLQSKGGYFIGYSPDDEVSLWLAKAEKLGKREKLFGANIDFQDFDTSVSHEMLLCAG